METKKRRVVFLSPKADNKLVKEQKRQKKITPKGVNRNIKVSKIVEDLVVTHL